MEMTDKINRFTKKTQEVLSQAVEEARRLNHDYVGTEHLLLGLISEDKDVTAQVLEGLEVNTTHVTRAIRRMLTKREGERVSQPTLTAST